MYIAKLLLTFMFDLLFTRILSSVGQEEKCLNDLKNIKYNVFMRLQGTSVSFKCNYCPLLKISYVDNLVEWLFNSSQNSHFTNFPVETFDNVVVGSQGIINLHNLGVEHSGTYWCIFNETSTPLRYWLDVDNGSEPIHTVHTNESVKSSKLLKKYNLKIYSEFTNWSACSKCDKDGEKIRYGYCTIISTENGIYHNSKQHSKLNIDYFETFENEDYYYDDIGEERENKREIKEKELDFIKDDIDDFIQNEFPKFQNKLPCRSRYTPVMMQNLPDIKERKTEIIKEACRVACKKNKIFEVRDKYGRLLERANNSAGIFSIIQGIPEAIPMPVRTTLYKEFDTSCELKCPGSHSETPIIWKMGKRKLIELNKLSTDRVFVDQRGHVIFKKLRYSDSNIYSCWQENKLSGTIRLKVTKEIQLKYDSHVVLFVAIVIFSVFLFIFCRAFLGRNRFTKH